MAGKKNNLSAVINQLGQGRMQGLSLNQSVRPTSLLGDSNGTAEKLENPKVSQDMKALSMNFRTVSEGIRFGSPSSTKTSASQTGSAWTDLLKQTASGGVASLLGGGLAGVVGLEPLISGIAGLFGTGSKKALPPALVKFQLPDSQDQSVNVSSIGGSANQANAGRSSGPVYGSSGAVGTQGSMTQPLRYQSAEIAQAVKTALLNSSSLNDIIAEI